MAKKGKSKTKSANKKKASSVSCKHVFMVKRQGHYEDFDIKKVYGSIYAATLNAHYSEKDAEMIAQQVAKNIKNKFCKHHKVSSNDIKVEVIHELNQVDKDIGFLYETHLDIN
ncbi:TPA: hypothetical protein HA246_05690 [Candidatus Woesearchaeota archaeon]|nr:hypothetical protein [Candidatus Woesearchaeota archaeon]